MKTQENNAKTEDRILAEKEAIKSLRGITGKVEKMITRTERLEAALRQVCNEFSWAVKYMPEDAYTVNSCERIQDKCKDKIEAARKVL